MPRSGPCGRYSLSVARGNFLEKDEGMEHATPDTKLRVRVQISRETIRNLKGYFLEIAPRRSAEALSAQLFNVPFEPYAPVRRQLLNLLRLVNQARQSAGCNKLSPTALGTGVRLSNRSHNCKAKCKATILNGSLLASRFQNDVFESLATTIPFRLARNPTLRSTCR